jgi:hypothetical protein
MGRSVRRLILGAATAAALLVPAAVAVVVIAIHSTALRRNPQFYSPALLILKADDTVIRIGEAGGWIRVQTTSGETGWIHAGAVKAPKPTLVALDETMATRARADEATVGGKGVPAPTQAQPMPGRKIVPPAAMAPSEVGEATAGIIDDFWKKAGALLTRLPLRDEEKAMLVLLNQEAVLRLIPLGSRRDGFSDDEKAEMEKSIALSADSSNLAPEREVLAALAFYRGRDRLFEDVLGECVNIADYVYWERLKARNPAAARRLGIRIDHR